MRNPSLIKLFFAIGVLAALSSCRKETITPDVKETPKFFTEAQLQNGGIYAVYAGKDDFRAVPDAFNLDLYVLRVPFYSSMLTNGKDTFEVALIGRNFASATQKANVDFLDAILAEKDLLYGDFLTIPSANIALTRNGKMYITTSNQGPAAGFHIIGAEEYSAPGSAHAMKKVDVTFDCRLENQNDPADEIFLRNGRATLVFTYE